MVLKKYVVAVATVVALAGCDETASPGQQVATPGAGDGVGAPRAPNEGGEGMDAGMGAPTTSGADSGRPEGIAGSDAGEAPVQMPQGDAGLGQTDAGLEPAETQPFDYEMEEVTLSADLVIPKGTTLRVGPGVTFVATAADVKVDVQGELAVEGSSAAPVAFMGNGTQSSWHGIVVADGAHLTLKEAQVGGAKYGIFAEPGSSYEVDGVVFDTSFKAAVLQSDGSVTNSVFKAEFLFPAITDEVSVDDPNGCLTIMDASPTVTNCRFDGSGGLNDMIRVGGDSSPLFDHIYVHSSHCGFHTSGGTNNSPTIRNSILENLAYGIMAYTTRPIIEDSVFLTNSTDVGLCSGATEDNTPQLSNNFYTGGAVKLDAACDRIGTLDATPAAAASPTAGPSGL